LKNFFSLCSKIRNDDKKNGSAVMIVLNAVNVTFGMGTIMEKQVLKKLNLNMKNGEFVTVIGSNGAGKSTLLNTIAGEVIPINGSLLIDDHNVTQLSSYERSCEVARVFQDPLAGTCADLTIAENLSIALKRGQRRTMRWAISRQSRSYFSKILKTLNLNLENRLDTSMSLLSGGQRQAVSLLMATLSPLKILLLDEHTSALDPKTADFIMDLTQKIIVEKKLTALMVTHSLHQALQFGTRTIMLHDGHIIYDVEGEERNQLTPQDLLKQFGKSVDDDRLLFQND
jgi:putative ABC transport system ATP-binding protein